MSELGWIVKERHYEDLYLCDIIFNVQISNVCVFSSSLQVPPHIMHRATSFCVLKLFAKFFFFLQSHFDLTSVTWHGAFVVVAAAAVPG